ncbi:GGDEF domain-containing protein [Bradyrhizobium prioriisuperbiae]|uniref:GGDEF domain-containing protein n=1 Tax=Bradyrhizobium prioriisuperbiae TaxID=2854389 RepID=UPI0028ECFD60|nr:GGDEF domain-containing protein [Bradyrhizobium prioritasuperba]
MFLQRLDARPGSISDAVLIEVLGGLYGSMVPIVFTGVAQAILGTIVAWQSTDMATAVITGLSVIIACIRAWDVLAFRRRVARQPLRDRAEAEQCKRHYVIGTAATAFIIGLFAARSLMLDDALCAMMAIGVGFGFGAGIVARLSMLPFVAVADLIVMGVPPIAVAMARLDAPHVGMAVLIAIYLVGSFEMVRLTFNSAIKQITLKHQFEQLARIDPMTGLFNRSVLASDLARMIAGRGDRTIAIHAIDLDHFKAANDRFGHPVGDALLKEVAGRLRSLAGDSDLIVRMGGDEFILVQTSVASRTQAERMAQRISEAVSLPYCIEGHDIVIGASIGVALSGEDGSTAEAILRRSDQALYRAKADRGGYVFARELAAASMPAMDNPTARLQAA